MAISLDGITLPDDLIWNDEYKWSKVSQNIKKSLTGALIIQEATQPKGRDIILKGDEQTAWIERSILDLLQVKYDTPDLTMTLNYHGTSYSVMFKRGGDNDSGLGATPIYELADPDDDHVYSIALNFIEV